MNSDKEWRNLTLKAAGISLIDCDHKTPSAVADGYPYIAIPQLKDGHITLDGVRRISSEDYKEWTKKLEPQENDVIVVRRCNSGQSAHVPAGLKCAIGQNLVVLRADGKSVLPEYLRWLVCGEDWWSEVGKYVNVGAVFDSLRCRDIPNFELPIPPLDVQREISQVLSALDDRITLLRETNTTLEAIAQALFKSWFVDFDPVHAKMQGRTPEGMDEATAALFPDSFEESELGAVPKGWSIGTLADLATFQNGYAFKSKDWSEAGHSVIKIGNVKPSLISFDGCSFVGAESVIGLDRFKLNRGDLLVGMTGYVGETGLVTEVSPAAYLNQRVGRIATSAGVKDLGFVFCLTRHEDFKAFAEGQSHGSAQANVSGSDLLKFKSTIPDNKVIRAFNEVMETLIESIMSNHEQAQMLGQLRDTLLPKLVSGELPVSHFTVESEA